MISTSNRTALLDDFLDAPALRSRTLVKPSAMRRWVYSLVLFAAILLGIIGLTDVFFVLTRASGSATDTALLSAGFTFLVLAGTLLLRFASPAAFAVLVADEGFAWRTLFGWHAVHWNEIDFVLIKQYSRFGSREVFMKAGESRVHFSWTEAGDADLISPIKSLPADRVKSLLHTIVNQARLQRHEAGVWIRQSFKPGAVSTSIGPW